MQLNLCATFFDLYMYVSKKLMDGRKQKIFLLLNTHIKILQIVVNNFAFKWYNIVFGLSFRMHFVERK